MEWICDREQCRFLTSDHPRRMLDTKGKFGCVLGGCVFFPLGLIAAIIFVIAQGNRLRCPACRRGEMLSTNSERGAALKARLEQRP